MSKHLLVQKIVDEIKLHAVHRILTDLADYDKRFDVGHIFHPADVVEHIMSVKLSDVFIEDVIRDMSEK